MGVGVSAHDRRKGVWCGCIRAALPLSLKAWDKYRPDLVNRSVIEIDPVRFEFELHLVIALARQPHLIVASRTSTQNPDFLLAEPSFEDRIDGSLFRNNYDSFDRILK